MVKDVQQIVNNLLNFYDFKDKTVISVGAGGGQFVAYGYTAKHVIAIDNDQMALERLRLVLQKKELDKKFTLVHSDFNDVDVSGDVILFEFCLHEMNDPQRMIDHALHLAKEVVIVDHGLKSQWAYIADEEVKAANSWSVVADNSSVKQKTFKTEQLFDSYEQLYEKVHVQGCQSIARIAPYSKQKYISIPMEYTMALLR